MVADISRSAEPKLSAVEHRPGRIARRGRGYPRGVNTDPVQDEQVQGINAEMSIHVTCTVLVWLGTLGGIFLYIKCIQSGIFHHGLSAEKQAEAVQIHMK